MDRTATLHLPYIWPKQEDNRLIIVMFVLILQVYEYERIGIPERQAGAAG